MGPWGLPVSSSVPLSVLCEADQNGARLGELAQDYRKRMTQTQLGTSGEPLGNSGHWLSYLGNDKTKSDLC